MSVKPTAWLSGGNGRENNTQTARNAISAIIKMAFVWLISAHLFRPSYQTEATYMVPSERFGLD